MAHTLNAFVHTLKFEAQDILSLELRPLAGEEFPAFEAGSHIDLHLPNGIVRSYSLLNDCRERHRYVIGVLKDKASRGGSRAVHEQLRIAMQLQISEPRNNFKLTETAEHSVLVAGGIGITPILSMMRRLLSQGRTDFKLYYCTRDAAGTAFMDELHAPELAGKITVHHDHGDPAKALDLWPVFERPSNAHVYCCGPQGLMDSVRDMTGHWPSERIHFESFGVAQTGFAENKIFDVVLQKSGTRMTVPTEQSILEVLRACGHVVSSSCESGTCGSCRTGLIAGEAEHRDMVLRPDEHTHQIMVCVSRAKSTELVLDL